MYKGETKRNKRLISSQEGKTFEASSEHWINKCTALAIGRAECWALGIWRWSRHRPEAKRSLVCFFITWENTSLPLKNSAYTKHPKSWTFWTDSAFKPEWGGRACMGKGGGEHCEYFSTSFCFIISLLFFPLTCLASWKICLI